ncbi:hypothetical protein DNTS_007690 [Danionella cerebrum]|uniref:Secreted protein n=1 Tax=Danionella cerebrum TaxID=2873325 RepID=A0A553QRQ7_9TELE|nr:hypothetical protein DNTS_007690 [Danionella translucida]
MKLLKRYTLVLVLYSVRCVRGLRFGDCAGLYRNLAARRLWIHAPRSHPFTRQRGSLCGWEVSLIRALIGLTKLITSISEFLKAAMQVHEGTSMRSSEGDRSPERCHPDKAALLKWTVKASLPARTMLINRRRR